MKEKDKEEKVLEMPSIEELEYALGDEYYKKNYRNAIQTTIYTLITVASIALLIATLLLPVVRIYSSAMEPTIPKDSIIVCKKISLPKRGEVLTFYYNNKILVRRVIALPGDTVNIDENGIVEVNGEVLQENYLQSVQKGDSDISYPYEVAEGEYFVLADQRDGASDSRNKAFGCIVEEDFIGKALFRVWPLDKIGLIK